MNSVEWRRTAKFTQCASLGDFVLISVDKRSQEWDLIWEFLYEILVKGEGTALMNLSCGDSDNLV